MRYIYTILFATFASLSSAEPSQHVETLMNTPLSILDWGLFKLENRLNEEGINASVSYNWSEDRILISVFETDADKKDVNMEQTKSNCEEVFNKIDVTFYINDGTDMIEGRCFLCLYFSHNGWTSDTLTIAAENIRDRFYYKYYAYGSNYCDRKAYGKSILVGSF